MIQSFRRYLLRPSNYLKPGQSRKRNLCMGQSLQQDQSEKRKKNTFPQVVWEVQASRFSWQNGTLTYSSGQIWTQRDWDKTQPYRTGYRIMKMLYEVQHDSRRTHSIYILLHQTKSISKEKIFLLFRATIGDAHDLPMVLEMQPISHILRKAA